MLTTRLPSYDGGIILPMRKMNLGEVPLHWQKEGSMIGGVEELCARLLVTLLEDKI